MTTNSYSHFRQGNQTYGNPIKSQNQHGELIQSFAKDNYKNSHIEVMWSGRRDCERFPEANQFELNLSRRYKNVASIELLDIRVPVCDDVVQRGSFYLFLWADNRPLELISLGDTTEHDLEPKERDFFSLDGAFAHFFVKNDPTIIHPYESYRRIFRFQTPLPKLTKLRMELRIYPANPRKQAFCLLPLCHVKECDDDRNKCCSCETLDVEYVFEINSQI